MGRLQVIVKEALQQAGLTPIRAEIAMIPATTVDLDKTMAESFGIY